mmetsp:Transcript_37254/g.111539  ORF Transcript_37254/g.111539 Transcript_37254/m.111539 type:complete len:314 (+) Transcript_37254:746-1687(+)
MNRLCICPPQQLSEVATAVTVSARCMDRRRTSSSRRTAQIAAKTTALPTGAGMMAGTTTLDRRRAHVMARTSGETEGMERGKLLRCWNGSRDKIIISSSGDSSTRGRRTKFSNSSRNSFCKLAVQLGRPSSSQSSNGSQCSHTCSRHNPNGRCMHRSLSMGGKCQMRVNVTRGAANTPGNGSISSLMIVGRRGPMDSTAMIKATHHVSERSGAMATRTTTATTAIQPTENRRSNAKITKATLVGGRLILPLCLSQGESRLQQWREKVKRTGRREQKMQKRMHRQSPRRAQADIISARTWRLNPAPVISIATTT